MRKIPTIIDLKHVLERSRIKYVVAALFTLATSSFAQGTSDVTLSFADGQDNLSGRLVEFKDDKYFIETAVGLVAIPSDGVSCDGINCPNVQAAKPEDAKVIVKAKDGSFTFAGELTEIDDDTYVLDTVVGVQRIPVKLVDCEGQLCPEPSILKLSINRIVELTNGKITLKGELLAYENEIYTLNDQKMGKVQVGAIAFDCFGESCP